MTQLPEEALAAAWRRDGLTPDGVAGLLGPVASSLLATGDRVPALRAAEEAGGALGEWVRLLVVGEPVPADAFAVGDEPDGDSPDGEDGGDAAGPDGEATGLDLGIVLVALGLAEREGDTLTPLVTVTPVDAGWVLADRAIPGRDPGPEHVVGPGPATRTLADLALPAGPGERVLDVGTGSGYLALAAATRGAEVVATDVNPRALGMARTGAEISGLDTRVDLRLGSLLDPARGERFDRIVSNPPFVISPRSGEDALTYRDGGAPGDSLLAELLGGLGAHLAPGGTAQLLANWEERDGEDWRERVDGWVDADLDLWVVRRDAVDPATYVDTWLRDGGTHPARDLAAFESAAHAWLADLEARGVTGIGMGHVAVRRRAEADTGGAPWRRLEEATGPVRHRLADHVAAVLGGVEALRPALTDEGALRAAHLVVAPDVTEVRHHRPGTPEAEVIELVQGGGYGRTVRASTGLAAVVGACDGELALGTLVDAVAALLETDPADLTAELAWWLRELVATGMLVPADPPEEKNA